MAALSRRAAALVLAITLGSAGWGECAGWLATPEARMECCENEEDCPMHGGSSREQGSRATGITQAEADSCCALSGTSDSTPSAASFTLSWSALLETTSPATVPPTLQPWASWDARHTPVPRRIRHVPKHVLLSVFLI